MISGRPPFDSGNAMQLFHAVVYEAPPNLAGSAAISALNGIMHRSMARRPDDRSPTAAAMADDLRRLMFISDWSSLVTARRVTRLIALPLRILRSDPETDFLAQAIPEAITTSLAGVASLIVRSSMAAVRFGPAFDPKLLAEEADVDVALTGTLLRAGEQLRVSTQLVEVPSGTVVSSLSSQATMSDLDRKSTRLNSSHTVISHAVFCLKKKTASGCSRGHHLGIAICFGDAVATR